MTQGKQTPTGSRKAQDGAHSSRKQADKGNERMTSPRHTERGVNRSATAKKQTDKSAVRSATAKKRTGKGRGGRAPAPKWLDWLRRQMKQRPLPVWAVVVADVLVFAVALNVFTLFHHVLPRSAEAVGLTSSRESMRMQTVQPAEPTPAMSPEATLVISAVAAATEAPAATATPDPVGYFGTKFADKFTDGEVIQNGWDYRSANLNISVTTRTRNDCEIYVCDIYVRDISCFATAFAKNKYGWNQSEDVEKTAKRANAIVSINGDYYGVRNDGAIIRNGTLYRDDSYVDCDTCVLYWDGSMKTFPKGSFDAKAALEAGAYQSWAFGPSLLTERGDPIDEFHTAVDKANPRTAIGYYEPGHYCLVVADGRSKKAKGLEMSDLSYVMDELGCKLAYNLDGGNTAQMVWGTKTINHPSGGGRHCSDIVLVREPE